MNNSIIPIIKELERIYDAVNKKFKFKYPRPIITVQTKGRNKTILGWFGANRWKRGKNEVGEINICAEELKRRPIETLIHEMAHYANHCEKIKDCSNSGYHNKNFKIKAENYGLNCEKEGRHGWAFTKPTKRLQIILKDLKINYKVFELYRKKHISLIGPTKMKKYRCECTTVRCAVDLKAICQICKKEFTEQ